jgi:3-methyladenine DNA glycosylase/8-oxoguanine DNA glycosylase
MPALAVETVDARRTLAWYRHGSFDPTTRIDAGRMLRATWTPDGPATVLADWTGSELAVDAWGPGAAWAAVRVPVMLGLDRPPPTIPPVDHLVTELARRHPGLRSGASGNLYHELLPTIIAQRVTSGEAIRQWHRLCLRFGSRPPGPFAELRLPPAPADLAGMPAWWFHPLGIEAKRAGALREIARVADRLWAWAELDPAVAAGRLALIPGVGPWTIGSVLGPALGDDDAVAVGDFHLPHLVAWVLAGEPRADDARMLALLEPYRGVRGRVLRLLLLSGRRAPARGPRRRILPVHRW